MGEKIGIQFLLILVKECFWMQCILQIPKMVLLLATHLTTNLLLQVQMMGAILGHKTTTLNPRMEVLVPLVKILTPCE